MRRKNVNKRASARKFSRATQKTRAMNKWHGVMRGGIRL